MSGISACLSLLRLKLSCLKFPEDHSSTSALSENTSTSRYLAPRGALLWKRFPAPIESTTSLFNENARTCAGLLIAKIQFNGNGESQTYISLTPNSVVSALRFLWRSVYRIAALRRASHRPQTPQRRPGLQLLTRGVASPGSDGKNRMLKKLNTVTLPHSRRDFLGLAIQGSAVAAAVTLPGISAAAQAKGQTTMQTTTCACRKLNPGILVMQPAQDWATKNVPGAIDGAREGCILLQG